MRRERRALRCSTAAARRGRLVGGNLALLAALLGTPYAPSFDGAILVLEDVNESIYRIDRMLTHLRLARPAGRLVGGIAFGHFTDIPEEPANGAAPLARRASAKWRVDAPMHVPR